MSHKVYFVDERKAAIIIDDPNMITEAIVGVCIYDDESLKTNTLYPWHRINKIERS